MKTFFKTLLVGAVLFTGLAFGQAARYDNISEGLTANNLFTVTPGATVLVYQFLVPLLIAL